MKKLTAISVCFILIFTLIVSASAADETEYYDDISCGFIIDGAMTCIIRNEYFRIYADNYFEGQFDEYNSSIESWNNDYIPWYGTVEMERNSDSQVRTVKSFAEKIRKNEGIWYCTVIFDYDPEFSSATNYALASSLADEIEVLYTGESTPCAVVGIRGATNDIDKIIENDNVLFVEAAFSHVNMYAYTCDIIDVQYKPTAADARKILRYSAGLEGLSESESEAKKFLILSDTDLDGKITAADARTALRIAAGLEDGHHYFHYTGSAWYY